MKNAKAPFTPRLALSISLFGPSDWGRPTLMPGDEAPWRGMGVHPYKTVERSKLPSLATASRVGPRTLVNPSQQR
jgi:hypothetical protein